MAITSARFYFFDARTGAELSEHPLNGSVFAGTGPWFTGPDGEFIRGHKTQISIFKGRTEVTVTTADFDGKCTRVKLWTPNPDAREEFVLVPETWKARRK